MPGTAAPSSSGRTADFGSVSRGSNPRGAANLTSFPAGAAGHRATWRSGLTRGSAKPLFIGSNPIVASTHWTGLFGGPVPRSRRTVRQQPAAIAISGSLRPGPRSVISGGKVLRQVRPHRSLRLAWPIRSRSRGIPVAASERQGRVLTAGGSTRKAISCSDRLVGGGWRTPGPWPQNPCSSFESGRRLQRELRSRASSRRRGGGPS
jgi:hypothetical protein